ncbi:MAG: TolB protein, partial [Actinomycetota bacterium]|nr:TolB protein [Actinomycetota bacterium]
MGPIRRTGVRESTRDSVAMAMLVLALLAGAVLYAVPSRAAFPGTNGKLALGVQVSEGGTAQFRILVQAPDGTGPISVSPASGHDSEPTWSPDGTRLAFTVGSGNGRQIGVMNADGSNRQIITGGAGQADRGAQPGWSPAGNKIVFTKPSSPGIFLMNADGTGSQTLLADGNNGEPVWSPNGQKIAFARNNGTATNVFVMNADGTGVLALTSVASGHVDSPDWSPDGTKLVVACPNG